MSRPYAFLVDMVLTTQFVMIHSSLTSELLKRFLTGTRLAWLYRAFYLIFSFLSLHILMYFWHPLGVMWTAERLTPVFSVLYYAGAIMLIVGVLTFSPLDMFGVVTSKHPAVDNSSKERRSLYTRMRHPFLLGLSLLFLTTPTMTYDRCFLATSMILFIYLSSNLQEEDVVYIEETLNDVHSVILNKIKTNWRAVRGNSY
eukprot:TRINITY_DN4554_c0_g1_i2.p1 TRINITY_DN4554_c0_g1~~TRINITY_DN4554_c0_g1_i2.p1  ORF type:complete len:200 (-),score=12.11 TRINITY_DN4554_c0_g1_i2:99-698(-)